MPEPVAVPEAEVRERLAAGDAAGAATLALRALGPSILRYLRSLLRDEETAREVFSRFAESLWRGLPGWRGEASLRGWAFRLAYHAALDRRDEAWARRGRRLETGEASRLAEELRTKTAVRVERQRAALDELRAALSEEDRSLLALRVDQELSWAEIAEAMSASGGPVQPAALMKRFERLKARLAELARDAGLVE
jgi:RNA polymerase sigma-70 factor (ECF subfamily)